MVAMMRCRLYLYVVMVALTPAVSFAAESKHAEQKPIFPKALAPGDTIEIIAPAKYLDKERVTLATKHSIA